MSALKLAFRTLFKTPLVTTVAILSLALGIGANAAIFSCFNEILLASLAVPHPGELVNFSALVDQTRRHITPQSGVAQTSVCKNSCIGRTGLNRFNQRAAPNLCPTNDSVTPHSSIL